jgi:hypothetical protein
MGGTRRTRISTSLTLGPSIRTSSSLSRTVWSQVRDGSRDNEARARRGVLRGSHSTRRGIGCILGRKGRLLSGIYEESAAGKEGLGRWLDGSSISYQLIMRMSPHCFTRKDQDIIRV